MGKFRIEIEPRASLDIAKHKKSGNQSTIKKIAKILIELSETPFEGLGNPEALKYELTGFWSRQINRKDPLIYRVEEDVVTEFIISAMGHYFDK